MIAVSGVRTNAMIVVNGARTAAMTVATVGAFFLGGGGLTGDGNQTKSEDTGQGGIHEGFAVHDTRLLQG